MTPVIFGPKGQPAANQQIQIASPLNDVQLVSLVAAQIYAATVSDANVSEEDAVAEAVEIVAQAVVQTASIGRRVQELANGGG